MARSRGARAAVSTLRLALVLGTAFAGAGIALAEQPTGTGRPSVEVDLSVLDTLPPPKGSYSGPRIVLRPLGAATPRQTGRKPDAPRLAPKPPSAATPLVRDRPRENQPKPVVTAAPKAKPAKTTLAKTTSAKPAAPKLAARTPDPVSRQAAAPPALAKKTPAEPAPPVAKSRTQPTKPAAPAAKASPKPGKPAAPLAKAGPPPAAPAAKPTGSNRAVAVVTPPAAKPKPDTGAARPGDRRTMAKPVTIAFDAGSGSLPKPPPAALDSLISQMTADKALRIVIYAYAKGAAGSESKARRLSFSRALSVRRYLVGKGVRGTRAEIRALGNKTEKEPADRVDLVLVKR